MVHFKTRNTNFWIFWKAPERKPFNFFVWYILLYTFCYIHFVIHIIYYYIYFVIYFVYFGRTRNWNHSYFFVIWTFSIFYNHCIDTLCGYLGSFPRFRILYGAKSGNPARKSKIITIATSPSGYLSTGVCAHKAEKSCQNNYTLGRSVESGLTCKHKLVNV
jgi:hypothetical protein